ncbi:hypothetical protein PR048_022522, partial [Dryococelus australis]
MHLSDCRASIGRWCRFCILPDTQNSVTPTVNLRDSCADSSLAAALIVMFLEENRRKLRKTRRSCWVREWLKKRNELGACNTLLHELVMEDAAQFCIFIRMTAEDIKYLIQKLGATLTKQDTAMRNAMSFKVRIVVTLRFLASGYAPACMNNYIVIMLQVIHSAVCSTCSARIPVCTVGRIVKEVCEQLFTQLKEDYMKVLHKNVLYSFGEAGWPYWEPSVVSVGTCGSTVFSIGAVPLSGAASSPECKRRGLGTAPRNFKRQRHPLAQFPHVNIRRVTPPFPEAPSDWLEVANDFERWWNFSHCVGALDVKHCVLQDPNNSGSYYFNYKPSHSIVLLTVADANRSTLGQAVLSDLIELPEPKCLPGRNKDMPYYLVADDMFPLSTYLMKPYPYRDLPAVKRIFNNPVSRARNTAENVFGVIAQRFLVLRKPMYNEQGIGMYTRDLLTGIPTTYIPASGGMWQHPHRRGFHFSDEACLLTSSQREVREELTNYFMTPEGEVRWQYRHLHAPRAFLASNSRRVGGMACPRDTPALSQQLSRELTCEFACCHRVPSRCCVRDHSSSRQLLSRATIYSSRFVDAEQQLSRRGLHPDSREYSHDVAMAKRERKHEIARLIEKYEGRPILWECTSEDYKNRDMRGTALKEITRDFNTTIEEVQIKIHNLLNQ